MQYSGWLNNFVAGSPHRRLGAIIDSQFVEDMNYMAFDGVRTDEKALGDFNIGGAFSYQAKHLNLTVRKVGLDLNLAILKQGLLFLFKDDNLFLKFFNLSFSFNRFFKCIPGCCITVACCSKFFHREV